MPLSLRAHPASSIELLGGEVLVKDVINHHHGRAGARGQALLLALEEDAAVGGALAERMPSLFSACATQLLGAAQHAGDIGADADVMTPARVRVSNIE